MRANRSAWVVFTGVVLAAVHAAACWRMFGGSAALATPFPYLNDDHPFNFYYTIRSGEFLEQTGANSGYDPFFMAGYAKSIVFPTSATLAELVVYLFGGTRPDRAYKLYVMIASALAPPILALAAWIWSRRFGVALGALVLHLCYFWTDWGSIYVVLGMVAFELSGSLTLLALAVLDRFVTRLAAAPGSATEGRWRRIVLYTAGWLAATATTALACLTHPVSAIVLAPGCLTAYLWRCRRLNRWQHLALWMAVAGVIVLNSFWLLPGLALLGTKGSTVSGFVNPNVGQRLLEPFLENPAIQATILVLFPLGLWRWWRQDRPGAVTLAISLAHVFFLAYLAGLFRSLDGLQPGRNTLYLFCWGALPASLAGADAFAAIGGRFGRCGLFVAALATGAAAAPALVPPVWNAASAMVRTPDPAWHSRMPAHLAELIRWLRLHTRRGERILFEESNRGVYFGKDKLPDPFGDFRIAPLLPLLTGLEVIGGPYLYAHQTTNFTQFGDGRFLGQTEIDPARFVRFTTWYDVEWIVCWSPSTVAFCRSFPELVEIVVEPGEPSRSFLIGRLKRPRKPAVIGSAQVRAAPNRIEVRNAQADHGIFVLRYHWTPNLRCNPPAALGEFRVGDDPVGLIRVTDPPPNFTITLDPWAIGGREK